MSISVKTYVPILIVATAVILGYAWARTLCNYAECMIPLRGLDGFKLVEQYQSPDNALRALFKKDTVLFRVEEKPFSRKEDAERYYQGVIMQTKGIFANAFSPYPGEVSREIDCSDEYKPVEGTIGVKTYLVYNLNGRMSISSCTADQVVYKDFFSVVYCERQNKLYLVEFIMPKKLYSLQSASALYSSLACK